MKRGAEGNPLWKAGGGTRALTGYSEATSPEGKSLASNFIRR
jgi:hypothetical protein